MDFPGDSLGKSIESSEKLVKIAVPASQVEAFQQFLFAQVAEQNPEVKRYLALREEVQRKQQELEEVATSVRPWLVAHGLGHLVEAGAAPRAAAPRIRKEQIRDWLEQVRAIAPTTYANRTDWTIKELIEAISSIEGGGQIEIQSMRNFLNDGESTKGLIKLTKKGDRGSAALYAFIDLPKGKGKR